MVDTNNMFSQPTSVVETADAYNNYFCSSSRSQDSHPDENIHIFLSSKDLVRFRYAKMKQSRKKGQWLVHDMEKLLDVPEHDDNDSDVDCFLEPLLNKIVIHPNVFEESLSRSSSNLVTYRKQLQESCLKIPSALHFAPIDGDQDFESVEVMDQDMSDNDSSCLIHDHKMSKLPFEDYSKHGPRLRTLCSEVCMSGANWDDIPWSYEATASKTDTKPEILVLAKKDSVAEIGEVLSQSNCIADIPASGSQEPEDCVMSSIYVTETPHMQILPEGFPNITGVFHNCLTKVAPSNSGKGNSNFMDLGNCLEVCSERCLEIEKSVEDIVNQKRRLVGMECEIDEEDQNRQQQRKRYCLDDLIADVVMSECQFHQKAMFHFDLAPLSLSLADGIFNFYSEECITSVSFKQLLEASKGMIDNEYCRTTMRRYFMALLSLAHQQNIGVFKGQVCGVQIHLQATSSCSLDDIMIYLEPPSIKQDCFVETSPASLGLTP